MCSVRLSSKMSIYQSCLAMRDRAVSRFKKSAIVGMDETSKQFVADVRIPIVAKSGRPQRYDMEYHRCGMANVFIFTESLGCWR